MKSKITDKEPIDRRYLKTDEMKNDYQRLSNKIARFTLFSKKRKVKKMEKKYPNNPAFKQLKIKYFIQKNKIKDVKTDIIENYTNYNDYLFAKIQYATLLIYEKKYDKVLEVFNNCNTLKELYQERDIFHISEYIAFYQLFFYYYFEIKNIEKAQDYFDAIFKHSNNKAMVDIYETLNNYQSDYVDDVESERL